MKTDLTKDTLLIRPRASSVQTYAKVAGVLILLTFIGGGFGEAYVPTADECCCPRPTVKFIDFPLVKLEVGNPMAIVQNWFVPLEGRGARLLKPVNGEVLCGGVISPATKPLRFPNVKFLVAGVKTTPGYTLLK